MINGISADILIVMALTKLNRVNIKEAKFTIFLVEKDSPGISCTEINTDGVEVAHINFDNTPVPSGKKNDYTHRTIVQK